MVYRLGRKSNRAGLDTGIGMLVNQHALPLRPKTELVPAMTPSYYRLSSKEGGFMGFGGMQALVMIAVLIGLVVAVTTFDLPGWLLPVGLITCAVILKGTEQRASE
jgi:hypothetical protein